MIWKSLASWSLAVIFRNEKYFVHLRAIFFYCCSNEISVNYNALRTWHFSFLGCFMGEIWLSWVNYHEIRTFDIDFLPWTAYMLHLPYVVTFDINLNWINSFKRRKLVNATLWNPHKTSQLSLSKFPSKILQQQQHELWNVYKFHLNASIKWISNIIFVHAEIVYKTSIFFWHVKLHKSTVI